MQVNQQREVLGTNPRTGTRLRVSGTFDTKTAAQEWKTKQLYQADQGEVNADIDSMISGAWLGEWLKRQQAKVDIGATMVSGRGGLSSPAMG